MTLDYAALSDEISGFLEETQTITLATSADNLVTARTMNLVSDGLIIYCQTSENSEKGKQIQKNPNVAMATDYMQVEAVAHFTTDSGKIALCSKLFRAKFPRLYEKYADLPEEPTLICEPVKFKLYKVIDGKPCRDVLDIKERRAYRLY